MPKKTKSLTNKLSSVTTGGDAVAPFVQPLSTIEVIVKPLSGKVPVKITRKSIYGYRLAFKKSEVENPETTNLAFISVMGVWLPVQSMAIFNGDLYRYKYVKDLLC